MFHNKEIFIKSQVLFCGIANFTKLLLVLIAVMTLIGF